MKKFIFFFLSIFLVLSMFAQSHIDPVPTPQYNTYTDFKGDYCKMDTDFKYKCMFTNENGQEVVLKCHRIKETKKFYHCKVKFIERYNGKKKTTYMQLSIPHDKMMIVHKMQ